MSPDVVIAPLNPAAAFTNLHFLVRLVNLVVMWKRKWLMNTLLLRCFLLLVVTTFASRLAQATDFHVYFLGGQSNMDGYGFINQLPEDLAKPQEHVLIFHGNTSADNEAIDGKGLWTGLRPGHGVGFRSDGQKNQYSNRFGVELTFARTIQDQFPERRIAIIKYSRGGTSIDADAAGGFGCWEPDFKGRNGVNQYDHFLATVTNAFADWDIDDDGERDRLIPAGIVWMQGESDAHYTSGIAEKYQVQPATTHGPDSSQLAHGRPARGGRTDLEFQKGTAYVEARRDRACGTSSLRPIRRECCIGRLHRRIRLLGSLALRFAGLC